MQAESELCKKEKHESILSADGIQSTNQPANIRAIESDVCQVNQWGEITAEVEMWKEGFSFLC